MSRPKYRWYSNVIRAIRYYPQLVEAKNNMQSSSVTANYSGMPKAGGNSRATENCAVRQLSPREEEELAAIQMAIEDVGRQQDGAEVLKIIYMVDWAKTHTLDGAAIHLHMSWRTAQRKRERFIRETAKNMKYS